MFKKITGLVTTLLLAGWVTSANAVPINVLLEVNIFDLSAVTITATGAAPSTDGSTNGSAVSGVSLWGLFSNNENNLVNPTGSLVANGITGAYNRANTFPSDKDLNLWCSGTCSGTQNFITSAPAFAGVATIDLTGYSILSAGSFGDIHDDDFAAGTIIGQWQIVDSGSVPAPATLVLLGLGLTGLGWSRRKKA